MPMETLLVTAARAPSCTHGSRRNCSSATQRRSRSSWRSSSGAHWMTPLESSSPRNASPNCIRPSSLVDESDDAARRGLSALDRNREGADHAPCVQHLLHVSAEVLHMCDAVTEGDAMHDEQVLF